MLRLWDKEASKAGSRHAVLCILKVFASTCLSALGLGFWMFSAPLRAEPPDHLVPVPPYANAAYHEELYRRLDLHARGVFQMLVKPARSAEYAVILENLSPAELIPAVEEGADAHPEEAENKPQSYAFVSRMAGESIWYATSNPNRKPAEIEVRVHEFKADCPPDLAVRLRVIWKNMLLQVQYTQPDEGLYICDGITYQFSSLGMYGEVRNPGGKDGPTMLAELGESLITYCRASVEQRPEKLQDIDSKCKALESYLADHS